MTIYGCRHLCVAMAVVFLLAFHQGLVFGQGTKITMEHDPVIDTDRDKPGEREQWFMRGRTLPGQATAALRYQAHLRKMQMREARKAALQIQGLAGVSTISGSWTPLGPSPLASDATGFGGQDYGAVSGRATSVAVDPNDPTGNTVFVGGAYGGVWKSSNAGAMSFNSASVDWTPLTDDQLTLAIGAIAVQPPSSSPDVTKSLVLAGTGETNSAADSYYGLGILRSVDGSSRRTL